jgi:hypothetical protein
MPGSGKTRLCHESFEWSREAVEATTPKRRVCNVFITFLNGEQITQADNLIGAESDKVKAYVAVGTRAACRLFRELGIANPMSLRSFRQCSPVRRILLLSHNFQAKGFAPALSALVLFALEESSQSRLPS